MSANDKKPSADDQRLTSELIEAAKATGIDAAKVGSPAVHVEGHKIHVRIGESEIILPAPSREAIDVIVKQYGGVILGALLTAGGVALGLSINKRA